MNRIDTSKTDQSTYIQDGFVIAALLACGITLAENTPDPDLWGHVRYAQDAFQDGHLHHSATHTFTANGYRWINHEILAEFALAAVYGFAGARGLILAKALLGGLVIGLMVHRSLRRGNSLAATCICALMVTLSLAAFWAVRPQLASFVLLAMCAVALNQAFEKWHDKREVKFLWLCALPPILAVWTNSHGGFAAGLCLVSAYLGVRVIEAFVYPSTTQDGPAVRERNWKLIGSLSVVVAACWLFTLINPYGFQLHLWLAESLRIPRPEITEWAAPSFQDEFFLPFVALTVLTLVALVGTKRRRDPAQLVLLLLCFWQATSHSRHIALFAILAGFWIPDHVTSLLARFKRTETSSDSKTQETPMPAAMLRIFSIALLCVFGLLASKLYTKISDFPVGKDEYPVSALQYMADQNLTGKLVVSFDWAQYALAALAPDVTVQFDGRFRTCYPQEVIDMHFDFLLGDVPGARHRSLESGDVDPTRVLRHLTPNLVLLDRNFSHSVHVMETMQHDFSLLYQDEVSQVWGRTSVYDNEASNDFIAQTNRRISDARQVGSALWPAFPTDDPVDVVNISVSQRRTDSP